MTQSSPLLAARGASRRFGQTHALEPVELEVWDGEALALVGPNRAGKSTLLSLLAGALGPSAGTIERRKGVRVGWAPQRPAQYGRLSARENAGFKSLRPSLQFAPGELPLASIPNQDAMPFSRLNQPGEFGRENGPPGHRHPQVACDILLAD